MSHVRWLLLPSKIVRLLLHIHARFPGKFNKTFPPHNKVAFPWRRCGGGPTWKIIAGGKKGREKLHHSLIAGFPLDWLWWKEELDPNTEHCPGAGIQLWIGVLVGKSSFTWGEPHFWSAREFKSWAFLFIFRYNLSQNSNRTELWRTPLEEANFWSANHVVGRLSPKD